MRILGITKSNAKYWIGSHYYYYGLASSLSYGNIGVRTIDENFGLSYRRLCYYHNKSGVVGIDGSSYTEGFRPVFTLNSEMKITEGDGNTTPYTLAP